MKSDIRLVREYPHPRAKVWRALTEPELMAKWGMRPEGFAPVVGTAFKLIGKAVPGWRGFIECVVTEARAPEVIAYSWIGNDGSETLRVKSTLEGTSRGTRLVLEHTGFEGVSGFLLSKIMMVPGWRKMLRLALPRVLMDLSKESEHAQADRLQQHLD
jgi:uncharacterized protein YndB with AHSA1/START domain